MRIQTLATLLCLALIVHGYSAYAAPFQPTGIVPIDDGREDMIRDGKGRGQLPPANEGGPAIIDLNEPPVQPISPVRPIDDGNDQGNGNGNGNNNGGGNNNNGNNNGGGNGNGNNNGGGNGGGNGNGIRINWQSPPAACLPGRMKKWENGLAEDKQAPCHCPPTSMCPSTNVKTMQDYVDRSLLPQGIAAACCPVPVCPAGTDLAGNPIPTDGNCNSPQVHCQAGFAPGTIDTGSVTISGCLPVCNGATVQRCDRVVDANPGPRVPVRRGRGFVDEFVDEDLLEPNDRIVCNNVVVGGAASPSSAYMVQYDPSGWLSSAWNAEGVLHAKITDSRGQLALVACQAQVFARDCVRSDSVVTLASGESKTIGSIKVGDTLKGPSGNVRVTAVNSLEGAATFYRINNWNFAVTGDHPIETTKGYKSANDTRAHPDVIVGRLEVGDRVITANGEAEVKTITVEKSKPGIRSVNISTEGDKPFFVDEVVIKPFKDVQFTY